jgi:Fe-S cluster biogenesis protein NfuA
VELLGFDDADGVVHLRLVGACSACPISTMTVKQGIERRLKAAVPEVREVQAV